MREHQVPAVLERFLPEDLTCRDGQSTWQVEEGVGGFQW